MLLLFASDASIDDSRLMGSLVSPERADGIFVGLTPNIASGGHNNCGVTRRLLAAEEQQR